MRRDLILVIDMQRVYLPGNPWGCPGIEQAKENILRILEKEKSTGKAPRSDFRRVNPESVDSEAINVSDAKDADTGTFVSEIAFTRFIADPSGENVWRSYNVENREINENPELNELLPEFLPYIKWEEENLYTKSVYSSFSLEKLRKRAMEITAEGGSLVLCGVVAECCVLATFFQAVDMGCHVIYLKDAAAGINRETEHAVERVIGGLCPLHGEIMTVEEYLGLCGK